MEIKEVKSVQAITDTFKTTLKKMMGFSVDYTEKVAEEAGKHDLLSHQPMQFLYHNCTEDMEKEFDLEIAVLVNPDKPYKGDYQVKELGNFKCASFRYKGSIDKIGVNGYEKFLPQVIASGNIPNSNFREVYHQWESPESENNIVEIQIGIN